mmetsp:Transcript_14160/g.45758  ORF Transcript_14160/g.45758 Transcript_14160/m.45758 type:complete len:84 (+) Transcript_14160:216-467(+)
MQGMPRCQHGAQTSAPSARCPHGAFIFFLVDWPSMCSEIAFVPETTQARTFLTRHPTKKVLWPVSRSRKTGAYRAAVFVPREK